MDNSILIGAWTKPKANNETNQIVIGYNAIGNGSNTIQLGNTSVTNVKTSGSLTAGTVTYPNAHNSSAGQVLTTDANGVASWSTPTSPTATSVGLNNVNNTSDADKPISTLTQTALDLKAPLASPTFTGTVAGITSAMVGLGNVNNTSDLDKPVSTATQTALDDKLTKTSAKIAIGYVAGSGGQGDHSIAIGGNVAQGAQAEEAIAIGYAAGQTNQGLNAVALGSGAGNNSQAANSIVINARGISRSLNAADSGFYVAPVRNLTSNNFVYYNTTTKEISYGGITKTMVGLSNVDNTTDLLKPISTATQTALDLKLNATDTSSLRNGINSKLAIIDTISLRNGINARATIASPTFTGTPAAPTASSGTNTTQIATTAFVQTAINSLSTSGSVTEVSDEATATGGETSFTLSNTPGTNSKVKMFINGIRISKTAYTISGTTLTYNPTNNGAYVLVVGDRIQFDFSY
jgi:hypothetical protein